MHRADKALPIRSTADLVARAFTVALAGIFAGVACAQDFDNVQEAQRNARLLSRPEVSFGASVFDELEPSLGPGGVAYAPDSPGDSDLGDQLILMPQSAYKPFSFRLIQQGIWTSNAALTERDTFDDFYSRTDFGFSYVPKILDNTYGEVTADYGFFRYADHSELDFDSLDAGVGVIHVFRELNDLSSWFRYNHLRLLEGHGRKEIFTDHTLEVGLYYPVPIGRKHLAFGSYVSEFSLDGNPRFAQRHEHSVSVGYSFYPTDILEFSAFYQFFVLDYREGGRTDLLHNTGVTLAAHVREGIDLVLSGTYALNDSNFVDGDYEVGDIGAALSIMIEF